jgi:hypothetical protein
VIWTFKPTQSGKLPVAVGRGGPVKIDWEVHGHGDIKLVVRQVLLIPWTGVPDRWNGNVFVQSRAAGKGAEPVRWDLDAALSPTAPGFALQSLQRRVLPSAARFLALFPWNEA